LGATRRQPQTSAHQHRRCQPCECSFHAGENPRGGFALTWPES
jgi:hypothetical protein